MTRVRLVEADQTAVDGRPPLASVAEYAYAAITPAGTPLVHVAGACPLAPDGTAGPVGDVAGQARRCLDNLAQALEAAGSDLAGVVRTTVYVASPARSDLVAAWEVVRDTFAPHRPPSTLLGVAVLGYPDQMVEVEAVAVAR